MRILVNEADTRGMEGRSAQVGGNSGKSVCVCVCICLCTYSEGRRERNRRGWQEIIKRLKKNKCLENRIKKNSARRLGMKLGDVGVCFLSRLLILCRQELCLCDETKEETKWAGSL